MSSMKLLLSNNTKKLAATSALCLLTGFLMFSSSSSRFNTQSISHVSAYTSGDNSSSDQINVLGTKLVPCSTPNSRVITGFNRDGFCRSLSSDHGRHSVCAEVTDDFLEYSRAQGNDLITPSPPHFAGLRQGDRWCLCSSRWEEAMQSNHAPPVVLDATNQITLQTDGITLPQLQQHAVSNNHSEL